VSPRRIPHPARRRAVVVAALPLIAATLAAPGCKLVDHFVKKPTPSPSATPAVKVATGPTPPKIDYQTIRPNELGRIPVVMYHEIGGKPDPRDPALNRTVADFRADLQTLYDAGFRPVNMADVVNDRIDVPAGKSPVVLTFDDARATQFKLIDQANSQAIDPNSAVGVMADFHKSHPDWPLKATFYVLPKSKVTLEPFGQLGLGNQKMSWLVQNGMEIGNHTTFHKDLRRMTADQIQMEIGNANNVLNTALAEVPGFKIETMAVPMGRFPSKANVKYLTHGVFGGKTYDYKCAMAASWRPIPSPDSKEFNPMKLERISPIDGLNGIRYWVKQLTQSGGTYLRYISDGDPNVISFPKGDESLINMAKIKAEGKLANAYAPFAGGVGGAKPIVMAPDAPSAAPGGPKPILAAGAPPAGGAADALPAAPAGDQPTVTEKASPKPITGG